MLFGCILTFFFGIMMCGCTNKVKQNVDEKMQSLIPEMPEPVEYRREISYPESWKKRVSIHIGKESSIKELLAQLADVCEMHLNMECIADKSGITYVAIDLPFFTILKEICRMVKWSLQINSYGDITIVDDESYFYSHEVAFLTNRASMSVDNNKKNTDSVGNLKSSSDTDLWKEIESNIAFLLKNSTVKYSINKQAGILIVHATQAEHEQIALFLHDLHMRVASQVSIEAHIVSVSCGNENPNYIGFNLGGLLKGQSAKDPNVLIADNVVAAINFIHHMGPITVIHSPRTMTMNNVPAMLYSWRKLVTYRIRHRTKYKSKRNIMNKKVGEALRNLDDDDDDAEFTSEPEFTNTGIVLLVQPSIIDDRTVSIYVRPQLSWVIGKVQDPIISIMGGSVKSEMPVLGEQSIETTISLVDRQTAIIGGLTIENEAFGSFSLRDSKFGFESPNHFKQKMMILISCRIVRPQLERIRSLADFAIMPCNFDDTEDKIKNQISPMTSTEEIKATTE